MGHQSDSAVAITIARHLIDHAAKRHRVIIWAVVPDLGGRARTRETPVPRGGAKKVHKRESRSTPARLDLASERAFVRVTVVGVTERRRGRMPSRRWQVGGHLVPHWWPPRNTCNRKGIVTLGIRRQKAFLYRKTREVGVDVLLCKQQVTGSRPVRSIQENAAEAAVKPFTRAVELGAALRTGRSDWPIGSLLELYPWLTPPFPPTSSTPGPDVVSSVGRTEKTRKDA